MKFYSLRKSVNNDWLTIQPISTKITITFHLKSLNITKCTKLQYLLFFPLFIWNLTMLVSCIPLNKVVSYFFNSKKFKYYFFSKIFHYKIHSKKMIFYWQNLIEKNKEDNDNEEKIINIGVLYILLCSMIWGEMWLLFEKFCLKNNIWIFCCWKNRKLPCLMVYMILTLSDFKWRKPR
jgi:hypothetical protein